MARPDLALAKATRRRGDELETAILDAAWAELAHVGFAKLTMESVASRAKTGVAVLYRRWANKDELVLAAIRHYGQMNPVTIPDMGNLPDDLRILLRNVSDARFGFVAITTATFAGLHDSAGLAPRDIRLSVIGGVPIRSNIVYARAQERGEIDIERIPQHVLELPFELMRHDMMMNLEPATDERIRAIIDDICWPLIERYGKR